MDLYQDSIHALQEQIFDMSWVRREVLVVEVDQTDLTVQVLAGIQEYS